MGKIYYVTKSQFKGLVESKVVQKKTYNQICEEIEVKRKTLNETLELNKGIVETIQQYVKAGSLTEGIMKALIQSQKVEGKQLQEAGVSKETIQKLIPPTSK